MIFQSILAIHILCGSISLLSAIGAMYCTKGQPWHRFYGKFFFSGMTGIFITSIPLSFMINSLFLFLIAIFSYYLAITGWRFARNHSGIPTLADWLISVLMLISAIIMLGLSYYHYGSNNYQHTVLLIFGLIGCLTSLSDLKIFYYRKATGAERIIKHMSGMLGATIAAVTAFAVTNFTLQPAIILWLGPTIIITPIIFWWQRKLMLLK